MNGANGTVGAVEEQHGDAVGRGHADAYAGHVGHQSVHALKGLCRMAQQGMVYNGHFRQVHLMGQEQTVVADAQQLAEQLAVAPHGLLAVATIGVDVELAEGPLAEASLASGAEGRHTLAHLVVLQDWFCHFRFVLSAKVLHLCELCKGGGSLFS